MDDPLKMSITKKKGMVERMTGNAEFATQNVMDSVQLREGAIKRGEFIEDMDDADIRKAADMLSKKTMDLLKGFDITQIPDEKKPLVAMNMMKCVAEMRRMMKKNEPGLNMDNLKELLGDKGASTEE